jgi:hypothetical protein
MVVRRILAGALLAPLLLLSACGGDDTSVADPPVSPTSPSTSTADPPHRESAKAFIRRWAAEDTRIQQTGNTTRFRSMSRGCSGCSKLADLVDRIYKAGGFIRTKGWRVRKIIPSGPRSYDLAVFSTTTTYRESSQGPVQTLPSGPATFQLHLAKAASSWRVTSLVQVAS